MTWDKKVAAGISVFGAIVVNLLGGWDMAVYLLCIVMLLDYFTGVLLATKNRKLSSSIGIDGIIKKIMILCMIALAVIVDGILGDSGAVRILVIMFYIGMEGISVLENAVGAGLPVPDRLRDALAQLKEQGKKASVVETVKSVVTHEVVTETTKEEDKEE